ncbi:MAG: hypothetical protein QOG03_1390 [Actinomycetota bacterium]|jgi:GNAT superfamily N-acetyltransferase|nr:hypothetical protein [Actinomycetota bacterium]
MGGIGDVLAAADRNMVAAWTAVLAVGPKPAVTAEGDLNLLSSGIPVPLFNPAFLNGAADPASVVAQVIAHYGGLDSPFVLYFRDEVSPGVAEAGLDAGLVEHWQPPLMVMDPIPEAPAPPSELAIVTVGSDQIEPYCQVLGAGFGMPVEIALMMFGPSLHAVDGFSSVVGFVDDVPVATASVFLRHGVAGVYNVATAPDRRGKGYGAALTWAAARAGAHGGATCSILQASSAGEPVYTRMGFATPTRYRQLEGPPAP